MYKRQDLAGIKPHAHAPHQQAISTPHNHLNTRSDRINNSAPRVPLTGDAVFPRLEPHTHQQTLPTPINGLNAFPDGANKSVPRVPLTDGAASPHLEPRVPLTAGAASPHLEPNASTPRNTNPNSKAPQTAPPPQNPKTLAPLPTNPNDSTTNTQPNSPLMAHPIPAPPRQITYTSPHIQTHENPQQPSHRPTAQLIPRSHFEDKVSSGADSNVRLGPYTSTRPKRQPNWMKDFIIG